jgi:hypothetical protein
MGREIGTSVRRVIKGPAATLFGIFSDTNRFDRISGVTVSRSRSALGVTKARASSSAQTTVSTCSARP